MLQENIARMHTLQGMDILIISTSNQNHEEFWQTRLDKWKGIGIKKDSLVICVTEDWQGGAGNGLGTLYAFKLAKTKAQKLHGIDIESKLKNGASLAIYHTAGQGKRLAPLTLSEKNNKSAVRLPGLWDPSANSTELITILEAVIKQTSIFAESSKGRLSVFWGDQIFIPSNELGSQPNAHIAILSLPGGKPTSNNGKKKIINVMAL